MKPRPEFNHAGSGCSHFSDVGLEIAARIPIKGEQATNAECAARREAVLAALIEANLPTGTAAHPDRLQGAGGPNRSWYTVEFEDRAAAGHWADSAGEAIIETSLWWGKRVVRVHRDADGTLHTALKAGRESVEVALW